MDAIALVESVEHVCVRYRLAPFGFRLVPLAPKLLGRLRQYRQAMRADAVILQRTLLPRFELNYLRNHAKRLIFDFDDAIWRRDSYCRKTHSAKRQRRFDQTVAAADAVVAGNDFLAQRAGDAYVIPTCVDEVVLRPKDHVKSSTLKLVWVGSGSTLRSLEALAPVFRALSQAFPDLGLRLICDRFFDVGLPTECVPWSAATESEQIASSDIGIAAMPDDDWSRGKCGVKVLQYLACGLPVIANPVGVHQSMLPAECLAATPADWVAIVRRLHDPAERNRLGAEGRRLVAERYSLAAGRRAWGEVFASLIRRAAC